MWPAPRLPLGESEALPLPRALGVALPEPVRVALDEPLPVDVLLAVPDSDAGTEKVPVSRADAELDGDARDGVALPVELGVGDVLSEKLRVARLLADTIDALARALRDIDALPVLLALAAALALRVREWRAEPVRASVPRALPLLDADAATDGLRWVGRAKRAPEASVASVSEVARGN